MRVLVSGGQQTGPGKLGSFLVLYNDMLLSLPDRAASWLETMEQLWEKVASSVVRLHTSFYALPSCITG